MSGHNINWHPNLVWTIDYGGVNVSSLKLKKTIRVSCKSISVPENFDFKFKMVTRPRVGKEFSFTRFAFGKVPQVRLAGTLVFVFALLCSMGCGSPGHISPSQFANTAGACSIGDTEYFAVL